MLRNDLSVARDRRNLKKKQPKNVLQLKNMMRKHPSSGCEGECACFVCSLKTFKQFAWQNDDDTAHHSSHSARAHPNHTITIYLGIIALACAHNPRDQQSHLLPRKLDDIQ